jgi:glycosyltransferase involved in cell wall biosynthesis
VSVIVPVYDDPRLAHCLDALARQAYPRDRFEVVVVDNGPAGTVAAAGADFLDVTVIHEPRKGSYAARNLGVGAARGDVLAFTDADCIPVEGWLQAGVDLLLRQGGADVVGGEVTIFPRDEGRVTSAELWECVWGFPQRTFVETKNFAATANLITHRRVFDAVGPFNPDLMSGGDVEWGRRAHRAGKKLVFSPEACVLHPARRHLRDLLRKYRRTCGGHYQLRRLHGQGHGATVGKLLRRPVECLFDPEIGIPPVQKLRYTGVESLLSAVQLLEMGRLACGGRPRRE